MAEATAQTVSSPGRFGHLATPLQRVHIELTNVCEFNCTFCPKSQMTRAPGRMDTGLAKRLISEIGAHNVAEKVTFHVMGEPTLHPDFYEILQHAEHEGVKVGLTTNGARLGGETGRRLLDYELHQVDVSLQTPDERSFVLRGAGKLSFEKYQQGVLDFFAAYHRRHPQTIFKFRFLNTVFRKKGLEDRCGPIRVISSTRELRETFARWVQTIYDLSDADPAAKAAAVARVRQLTALKWNVVEVAPNVFFETYVLSQWDDAARREGLHEAWAGYCHALSDHFGVLYNGDVVLCCMDFDGRTAVGNVTGSTLEEVLSGEQVRRIVEGFRRFRVVHPYCRRCLGSRSWLAWLLKPAALVLGLKVLKPLFYKKSRLYA